MIDVKVKVVVWFEGWRVVAVVPGIDLVQETVPGPEVDAPGRVVADRDGDTLYPLLRALQIDIQVIS